MQLGVGWLRDKQGDWANTAAAGAAAGGLLGLRGERRCSCQAGSWNLLKVLFCMWGAWVPGRDADAILAHHGDMSVALLQCSFRMLQQQ